MGKRISLTGLGTSVIYIQKNENGNISCPNRRINSKSMKYLNVRPEIKKYQKENVVSMHNGILCSHEEE
jgi:hypothetical protein